MKKTFRLLAWPAICLFFLSSAGCFVSAGIYVTPRDQASTSISESDIQVVKEVCAQVAMEFGMSPTPAPEVEAQEAHFRSVLPGGRIIASYDFRGSKVVLGATSVPHVQKFPAQIVIAVGNSHHEQQIYRRIQELLNQRLGSGRAKFKWQVYANFASYSSGRGRIAFIGLQVVVWSIGKHQVDCAVFES